MAAAAGAAKATTVTAVPCGIGLRAPHARQIAATRPALGCLEVHAENFFAAGGASRAMLMSLREHYPVSVHGVGLSLGSACGVDAAHLAQLAALVRAVAPVRVSDHASFARALLPERGGTAFHAHDLLPIAFTRASLDILVANVQQVQDALQRPLLVEHLSAYIRWVDADMSEPAFFNALMRRSGCGLLLDVNNLVVNALNEARQQGEDGAAAAAEARACAWIDALELPLSASGATPGMGPHIGEIHLAGHADVGDIVIDDHASRVSSVVWAVYRHAVRRFGPVPTVVEWDNDLPPLADLLEEARMADAVVADVERDRRAEESTAS